MALAHVCWAAMKWLSRRFENEISKNMKKHASASKRAISVSADDAGRAANHYAALAFKDYIASRVLINNDLPLQGLIFASTCVEKYLKAVLCTAGFRTKAHLDSEDFLDLMRNKGVDVCEYLSESFICYLGRAFEFRYIEPSTGPISIAIERYKILAELDFTVYEIESRLTFFELKDVALRSVYQNGVENKDSKLYINNYILQVADKTSFVERFSTLYLAFAALNQAFIEIRHQNFKSSNNSNFDYPKVSGSGRDIIIDFGMPIIDRLTD